MSRVSVTQLANGTTADATQVNSDLNAIANVVNGAIDLTNITPASLDNSIFLPAYDPVIRSQDTTANFVKSGLTIATSGTLSSTITSGVAWVNGKRIAFSSTPITVVASKDTYIDLKDDGTIAQVNVNNGITAGMTLTTNSDGSNALRIAKVVSSGTAITSVSQLAILIPSASAFSGFDPIGNRIYPQLNDTSIGRYIRPSSVTTGQPGATSVTYNGCNNIPFQAKANTEYVIEFYEPVVSGMSANGVWVIEAYLSASVGAYTTRIDEFSALMLNTTAATGIYFELPFNSGSYSGLTYLEFKLRSSGTTGTATMNGDTSTRMGRFTIYKR